MLQCRKGLLGPSQEAQESVAPHVPFYTKLQCRKGLLGSPATPVQSQNLFCIIQSQPFVNLVVP